MRWWWIGRSIDPSTCVLMNAYRPGSTCWSCRRRLRQARWSQRLIEKLMKRRSKLSKGRSPLAAPVRGECGADDQASGAGSIGSVPVLAEHLSCGLCYSCVADGRKEATTLRWRSLTRGPCPLCSALLRARTPRKKQQQQQQTLVIDHVFHLTCFHNLLSI